MEWHIKIIGALFIILSLIHIVFPKQFNWKKELTGLSLMNRQMMHVHTFFIALGILLMGLLCITSSKEIIETALGKKIAFGLFIFWILRFFTQFFGYSSKLWKGKKLETIIHILFSFFWAYVSVIFFIVYWNNK